MIYDVLPTTNVLFCIHGKSHVIPIWFINVSYAPLTLSFSDPLTSSEGKLSKRFRLQTATFWVKKDILPLASSNIDWGERGKQRQREMNLKMECFSVQYMLRYALPVAMQRRVQNRSAHELNKEPLYSLSSFDVRFSSLHKKQHFQIPFRRALLWFVDK